MQGNGDGNANMCNIVTTKCLKKKFSPEEDKTLKSLVEQYGTHSWKLIADLIKTRNCRQCRERWRNYLSQNISIEPWSKKEDLLLQQKYNEYGPQWTKIQTFFVNRTDVNLKNRWAVLQRRIQHNALKSNPNNAVEKSVDKVEVNLPIENTKIEPVRIVSAPAPTNTENKTTPLTVENSNPDNLFVDVDDFAFDIYSNPFNDNDDYDDNIFVF